MLNECNRDNPIKLKNGNCTFEYCEEEKYNSGECVIDNKIIKTQFPNNIIFVGTETLRYLNFITFSNEDMLFQTSAYPESNKRIFYGLKKNGRGYFKHEINLKETPFYTLKANKSDQCKLESTNSIFIKDDGKEYFISMGRIYSYCEIFDHENKILISKKAEQLIGFENINRRSNLIKISKNSNSYILSGLKKKESDNNFFPVIMKFDLFLNNSNDLKISIKNVTSKDIGFSEIGSCFTIEEKENYNLFF